MLALWKRQRRPCSLLLGAHRFNSQSIWIQEMSSFLPWSWAELTRSLSLWAFGLPDVALAVPTRSRVAATRVDCASGLFQSAPQACATPSPLGRPCFSLPHAFSAPSSRPALPTGWGQDRFPPLDPECSCWQGRQAGGVPGGGGTSGATRRGPGEAV